MTLKATFYWFAVVSGLACLLELFSFMNGDRPWVGVATGYFIGIACFIADVGYRLNERRREKKP